MIQADLRVYIHYGFAYVRYMPIQWNIEEVIKVTKPESLNEKTSYRLILLLSTISKILENISNHSLKIGIIPPFVLRKNSVLTSEGAAIASMHANRWTPYV